MTNLKFPPPTYARFLEPGYPDLRLWVASVTCRSMSDGFSTVNEISPVNMSLDSEQITVDLSQDGGVTSINPNDDSEKTKEITAEELERARISLTLSEGLHAAITEDQCVEYYRRLSAFDKAKNIGQK